MSRVFVDTSALLALIDADDPRGPEVVAEFAAHRDDELVTHGYVVAESLAVVRRRFGVEGTVTLLDDVLPSIAVLPVDPELHEAAQQAYRASLPSATSFVDRVSLAVIARDGIDGALALDPDLATSGLTLFPRGNRAPFTSEFGSMPGDAEDEDFAIPIDIPHPDR